MSSPLAQVLSSLMRSEKDPTARASWPNGLYSLPLTFSNLGGLRKAPLMGQPINPNYSLLDGCRCAFVGQVFYPAQ
jgi:hypothetical protein